MEPIDRIEVRRRTAADMPGAFRVFRRSLYEVLRDAGVVDAATAQDPPIEAAWARRRSWMEHLAATAAEDWVAEDEQGQIVGWAQSVKRDGDLELTSFFVDPGVQLRGIGRRLLERAFPLGAGRTRSINASLAPRALALYLKFGVHFVGTAVSFLGPPRPSSVTTDLVIEPLDPSIPDAEHALVELERELLGHGRRADTRFLLKDRPSWLARRGGRPVGFAFGLSREAETVQNAPSLGRVATGTDPATGPMGALDPGDVPALMATVENDVVERGLAEIGFTIPLNNAIATRYALDRGLRIEPEYFSILNSDNRMKLDRWVHTRPEYIT